MYEMRKIIALVIIQNFVIGQIQVPAEDGLDLFNDMMRYLFNNCRSEFGTIGFWGNDRIFLANHEADFVLLNDSEVFISPPTRRIKFFVEIYEEFNSNWPVINMFQAVPTPEIETMFIFDKGGYSETVILNEFSWYQRRFRNSKFYYCFEWDGQIVILTLNALADFAPLLWTKGSYISSNKSDLELQTFETTYNIETKFKYAGVKLCKSIFFDRTAKLNGYTIRAVAKLKHYFGRGFAIINGLVTKGPSYDSMLVLSRISTEEGRFIKVLTDYLDVSVNIVFGMPTHISLSTWNMLQGDIELDLSPTTWTDNDENFDIINYFHLSYPFYFFHEQIVTHNRGLASPLEKMFEFYGWLTIIATLIIILIVFIVIYLSNSGKSSKIFFAFFECLRILINNSIYTRMNTAKIRIFFSVIFLYFLIIQATFSGHLAAFLTKPVYRKNVEALEDLEDPRYTKIYASERSRAYIKDTPIFNKTLFGEGDCEEYIQDPSVACIGQKNYLIDLIPRYNLHTPKNFIKFDYATLTMPHNWVLRHRVDNLVMRLAQSGILDLWDKAWLEFYGNKSNNSQQIQKVNENYHRPIELEDVMFAFVLLASGLFLSFGCFLLEFLYLKLVCGTKQNWVHVCRK